MKAKRPAPPLVMVEWEDATNVATWEPFDDAVDFTRLEHDYHCTNVGYLIRDDETCVIVAARATTDFEAVGLFERIPRGMVQRVTPLVRER